MWFPVSLRRRPRESGRSVPPVQQPQVEPAPPLPAVAAKAEDLEALRKSIEDTAAVGGGLWLSYLFVLFYLGIAASAVTHIDLFVQNPVKLPFLNIELPLLAFFFLAPLLFVITHAYTLVNLALLADRVKQFHNELRDQLADPALASRASEIRAGPGASASEQHFRTVSRRPG